MTHSAFSKSSWGMFSGTLSTSCNTTPLSSRRFCSLFNFWAYAAPATRVKHTAVTINLFIADLHGQNLILQTVCFKTNSWLKDFQHGSIHEGVMRCPTLRRDTFAVSS